MKKFVLIALLICSGWAAQAQAQDEFVQTFLLKLKEDLSDKQLNVLFPNTTNLIHVFQMLAKCITNDFKSLGCTILMVANNFHFELHLFAVMLGISCRPIRNY